MQDLFGPAARATEQHNLFFGLMPDAAARAQMRRAAEDLRARHDTGGRWVNPARYHMTLQFLGTYSELPETHIGDLQRAADSVRVPAFELVLDRCGHFRHGIGWLGCAETAPPLQRLWDDLRRALAHARVAVPGHTGFTPHVTVLRDARRAWPEEAIGPVRWPVREFVLVDSVLGTSSEYRPLGSWPLQG